MARPSRKTLEELAAADLDQLKHLWQRTFSSTPPLRMPKQFLIKLLAQAAQEKFVGGMPKRIERQLAAALDAPGDFVSQPNQAPADIRYGLGSRLVRGWGGKTHEVMVVDRGFAYRGKAYRSLSEIAKVITGAHWSGPRFFGLKGRRDLDRSAGDKS